MFICSSHFKQEHIKTTSRGRILKHNAIPFVSIDVEEPVESNSIVEQPETSNDLSRAIENEVLFAPPENVIDTSSKEVVQFIVTGMSYIYFLIYMLLLFEVLKN